MKLSDEIREFFRKQGASGGKTRARNLSPEQRSEGARKAAQARWAQKKAKTAGQRSSKQNSKRGGKQ